MKSGMIMSITWLILGAVLGLYYYNKNRKLAYCWFVLAIAECVLVTLFVLGIIKL